MLLTERPGTLLGGIRSTAVNERRIRADRLGSRSARAHSWFAPRCGGRRLVVHDAAQAATPPGGGPRTNSDEVTGSSDTSTIVACLCRIPPIVIFPCSSTAACASAAGTSTRSRMEAWFSSGPLIPAHPPGPAPGSGRTLANDGVDRENKTDRHCGCQQGTADVSIAHLAPVQTIRCDDHGPVLIARHHYVPVSMACPRTFVVSCSRSQMTGGMHSPAKPRSAARER